MRTKEVIVSIGAALFLLAIRSFSQSPPSRQQQMPAHMKQARVCLTKNKPDQAAAESKAIVTLDPKNTDAQGEFACGIRFTGTREKNQPCPFPGRAEAL